MKSPWTRWCIALGLAALASCSGDEPTAPRLHSITGNLTLTGYLVDEYGQFAGTRVMGDADGIPVELLHGDQVVGRTVTMGGVYRFSGLAPGGYVARSRVIGDIADQTNPMTIAVTDIRSGDTLRLASRGDIYPIPNPFEDTTWVYFNVPDTQWVEVGILDVEGNPTRTLLALRVIPWRHAVMWNGRDRSGRPVTGSLYWVTYVSDIDVRAHVLFRRTASARRPGPAGSPRPMPGARTRRGAWTSASR